MRESILLYDISNLLLRKYFERANRYSRNGAPLPVMFGLTINVGAHASALLVVQPDVHTAG